MRNPKEKKSQPVYPLVPAQIFPLKDAIDWKEFKYQPHQVQKDFITYTIWRYYDQNNFGSIQLSLLQLLTTMAHSLADEQDIEIRNVTRKDLLNVSLLIQLLVELEHQFCLPQEV